MTKKGLIIISTILILGMFVTGVTFAYLNTTSDTKINEFHPGELDAPIVEDFDPPGEDNETKKEVWVNNTNNPHEVDAYIRVMLIPTFRDNGNSLAGNIGLVPSQNKVIIDAPNGGTVTLKLPTNWSSNWIYINGYFYHKSIVSPGGSTALILEKVEVSDNELWNTFQLEILSDAIQAEMGAAEDAWDDIEIGNDSKLKEK